MALNTEKTIFINLLDEGTRVLRPVNAILINENIYEIIDKEPSDENWEFKTRSRVECQVVNNEGKNILVAKKLVLLS